MTLASEKAGGTSGIIFTLDWFDATFSINNPSNIRLDSGARRFHERPQNPKEESEQGAF